MSRSVSEWIGKTDDTAIPTRVRLRVFDSQKGLCAECGRKLAVAGEPYDIDHTQALINGGENRESNLRALCRPCHKPKTAKDVAQKATENRKKAKARGDYKSKNPLPGGRGSKWKKTVDGRVVLRNG